MLTESRLMKLSRFEKDNGDRLDDADIDNLSSRGIKLLYGITGIPDGVFEDNWTNRQILMDSGIACSARTFDEFVSACFQFREYLIVPAGYEYNTVFYVESLKRYTNFRGFLTQGCGNVKFIFGATKQVAQDLIKSGLDGLSFQMSIPYTESLDNNDVETLIPAEVELGFGMGYIPGYDSRYIVNDNALEFLESCECLMEFDYRGPWISIMAHNGPSSILDGMSLLNPAFCNGFRILSPDERRDSLYALGKQEDQTDEYESHCFDA